MSEVNLLIRGRSYGVGCDDGQEKRVKELGQYIDRKVREIGGGAGAAATEAHLLVLACLVMADELFETREGIQSIRAQMTAQTREIENLQQQMAHMAETTNVSASQKGVDIDPVLEAKIAGTIENLSSRLESLAKRLQAA